MKYLLICLSDPGDFTYGASQRDNNLRDSLLYLGSVDTIIWRYEDPPVQRLGWNENRVQTLSIASDAKLTARLRVYFKVRRLIAKAHRENNYDLIVVRHFPRTLAVPLRLHKKMVVDADDFRTQEKRRPLHKKLFVSLRTSLFRMIGGRARHVWVVDIRDRATLNLASEKVSSLPNTARAPRKLNLENNSGKLRISMVGFFAYKPNVEGLAWFVEKALPEILLEFPDVELHAIGKFPAHDPVLRTLNHPVIMRGFVDDLDCEYVAADVVVCPIISGSGTQIKVLEALMHGRPTVATRFAYEGFSSILKPGRDLLVADDGVTFGQQVLKILRHPRAFKAMGESGRRAVESVHGVSAFHERVIDTLSNIHSQGRTNDRT